MVNERRFSKMKSGGSSDMPSKASRSYRRPAAVPPARAGSGTAQVNVPTTVPVTGAAAAATSAADGAVKSAGISSSKLGQDRATTVAVSMRFAAAGSTIVAVGAQGAKPRTLLQPKRTLLRHAVQALVESAQQQQQLQIEGDVAIPTNSQDVDFSAVELTFPLPKRQLSQSSPELDM